MKKRFFSQSNVFILIAGAAFFASSGSLAATWSFSTAIGSNTNLGVYQDFGLGLFTDGTEFDLRYREFGGFLSPGFYWVRLEAQKAIFCSNPKFSAGVLAGVSLDSGIGTVLAPQAGLFVDWRFWGDLGLVSLMDNAFYSDSVLCELETGFRLDHFLFRPLFLTALFPAYADVSLSGQPTGWTWGVASVGLEWEFE